MKTILEEFVRFLDRSKTSWHAARQIANRLAEADFTPLIEGERWTLENGRGYFVVRDDAAVCAFRLPKAAPQEAVLLASHLDSPGIKIKPVSDSAHHRLAQLNTEVYGSPLLHTWLDRDLGIAGRVFVQTAGNTTKSHLVFLDDYPLIIPSLPIHLDRSQSDKGLLLNKQDHLKPIASISRSKEHPATLETLLRRHITFEQLLSFDLFLTPLETASFLGAEGEMICSAKLDNLTSAFACAYALAEAEASSSTLQLAIFWDHEEIGSKSYLGAESFFVNQVIERICLHRNIDREDYYRLKAKSYCVSVDLAHGFNPNYSDRFDPHNAPYLGDGVVLKTNAMQRYATSAATSAPLLRLCRQKGVPYQKFASRSDIPSGGTVGSIMSAVAGFPTVDIGIAGWAMHSIRETIAAQDEISLCQLLKALLEEQPFAPEV